MNTWEHGAPGDFPLVGVEVEASLECLRHRIKGTVAGEVSSSESGLG